MRLPSRSSPSRLAAVIAIALLSLCTLPAQAQVAITLTATANLDFNGYTKDQAYTLVLTLNHFDPTGSNSYFTTTSASWQEAAAAPDSLYTSVSGDLFAGTLSRPANRNALFGLYCPASFSVITLSGGTSDMQDIGLRTPSSTPVYFYANISVSELFTPPAPLSDPATYLINGSYLSAYTLLNTNTIDVRDLTGATLGSLTVQTLSFASAPSSPVPEPSTCALFAGLAILGAVVLHRRFRRA